MPKTVAVGDHTSDGMMLIGPRLNFTSYTDAEKSDEGFMFYTTDPTTTGYTLNAQGRTILRKGRP